MLEESQLCVKGDIGVLKSSVYLIVRDGTLLRLLKFGDGGVSLETPDHFLMYILNPGGRRLHAQLWSAAALGQYICI